MRNDKIVDARRSQNQSQEFTQPHKLSLLLYYNFCFFYNAIEKAFTEPLLVINDTTLGVKSFL